VKPTELEFRAHGGKRNGAGRPPNGEKAGVSHLPRPELSARHPVHVTLRLAFGVGYLRSHSRMRVIEAALRQAKERFGLRIIHYSVQGMHLHLIVEAEDREALSRGMQGLGIRLAKRLNSLVERHGPVFADRYHAHVLKSRREVANALRYVAGNYAHHARENVPRTFVDPCSSARWMTTPPPEDAPIVPPTLWLLRNAAG
jgi:REP element-mobilizing transposase RayT